MIKLQHGTQRNTNIGKVNNVFMLPLAREEESKKTKYIDGYTENISEKIHKKLKTLLPLGKSAAWLDENNGRKSFLGLPFCTFGILKRLNLILMHKQRNKA